MRISDWSSDVCSSDLRAHLDLAGRQIGVHRLGRSRHDFASDRHHALGAQGVKGRKGRIAAVGDDLRQAIMVAQIDEEQPAMVALAMRSEEHTSELQSLMRHSYAVFCLKKKKRKTKKPQ